MKPPKNLYNHNSIIICLSTNTYIIIVGPFAYVNEYNVRLLWTTARGEDKLTYDIALLTRIRFITTAGKKYDRSYEHAYNTCIIRTRVRCTLFKYFTAVV